MERISNIRLSLDEDEKILAKKCAKILRIGEDKIKYLKIIRKSLDARKRGDIHYVYTVDVDTNIVAKKPKEYKQVSTDKKVVVIGFGPAGLFCALNLARHGIKPLVLERGDTVENRKKKVEIFSTTGKLDLNSNVQFGEGGAGTFSDGKLNTQVNNRLIDDVLQDFVEFGAPSEIAYVAKPHIGSDKLSLVVSAMRNEIIRLGGEIRFNTLCEDFIIKNSKIVGVKAGGDTIYADAVVLAVGHSARDTFQTLYDRGVLMEQKEFAVGVRCEQLQSVIDKAQFGKFAGHKNLKPADFKLVSHASERSVFSFCMCPGGVVMPASSEEGCVVTNGMSNYARDAKNANSAIIAQVRKSDFSSTSPLASIEFQRELERGAFNLGGGDYCAPVQLAKDFISGTNSNGFEGVLPSYRPGFKFARLDLLFNKSIADALKNGLVDMDNKLKGIASLGAVLTGVESRTSSPIRILRGDSFESVNVSGLYPCGEGCGYAGGIMSASIDGLKVSNALIEKFGG